MRSGSGRRTSPNTSTMRLRRSAGRSVVCTSMISSVCRPTVISGLSAAIGSWKIMAMRPPRTARMPSGGSVSRSLPSYMTRPPRDAHVRLGQQAQDRLGHHRLAGARFAHDAQDLLAQDLKRDAVDGERPIGPGRQADAEVLDGQDGVAHRSRSLGLSASLRPSPTRLIASTVSRIATPGPSPATRHRAGRRGRRRSGSPSSSGWARRGRGTRAPIRSGSRWRPAASR